MSSSTAVPAVRREVTVHARIERAFSVFTDRGDHGTLVALEHRGFKRYAQGGQAMRDVVDSAGRWGLRLERYAGATS